jgi:hypothetical protein
MAEEAFNTCASSLNEVKTIVFPLDLPHTKYHVCLTDYIIYWNKHADETACLVYGVDRYKRGTKKAPRKVVWYFSLRPCLQWYFMDPKEANTTLKRTSSDKRVFPYTDERDVRHRFTSIGNRNRQRPVMCSTCQ